jgi:hypothetical protein
MRDRYAESISDAEAEINTHDAAREKATKNFRVY